MKASEFNKQMRARRRTAEAELAPLAAAYEKVLRKVDREAVAQFKRQALVASPWQPPPEGNLLEEAAITAYAGSQVARIHRKVLTATAGPTLVRLGISWDVVNPFAEQLLAKAAQRTGAAVSEAVQPRLREIILGSYEKGLSVQDTAGLIEEKLTEFRPASARMLARTDLNGIANGASVMAATLAGVKYKQWLTAEDDRVRQMHMDADGQSVPVDQPFQVGGEELMFPGDPGGSDENTCNCRCTVFYSDGVEEVVASATQPQPVTVQVAAATTSPETDAVVTRMGELLEELSATLAELRRPTARRVTVTRNEFGEIVSMHIRDD